MKRGWFWRRWEKYCVYCDDSEYYVGDMVAPNLEGKLVWVASHYYYSRQWPDLYCVLCQCDQENNSGGQNTLQANLLDEQYCILQGEAVVNIVWLMPCQAIMTLSNIRQENWGMPCVYSQEDVTMPARTTERQNLYLLPQPLPCALLWYSSKYVVVSVLKLQEESEPQLPLPTVVIHWWLTVWQMMALFDYIWWPFSTQFMCVYSVCIWLILFMFDHVCGVVMCYSMVLFSSCS